MTPDERAKTVLHFLDRYLSAREDCLNPYSNEGAIEKYRSAREFLGTALVALVTEVKEDEGHQCWSAGLAALRKSDD